MASDRLPRRAAMLGVVAVVVLVALTRRDRLWRDVYPYLPARMQAVPYVLRTRLAPRVAAPVPVPSPAAFRTIAPPAAFGPLAPSRDGRDRASGVEVAPPRTSPEATQPARPSAVLLHPFRHEYQTWNNCGPATLSILLSHLGVNVDQRETARLLKPDPDDKNVSPSELARLAIALGLQARLRENGTLERLRRLIANGHPAIVETWFVPEPGDEMAHYRVVSGYDDAREVFVVQDSFMGPNVELAYAAFDRDWRAFNRLYLVIHPPAKAAEIDGILGADRDDRAMHEGAIARAQSEIIAAGDAFAWFNLGSSLLSNGDAAGAAEAFDRARAIGLPWRMLWYQFAPFEAYAALARWDDVRGLAEANLRNADNLEESLYWLGRAHAATGDVSAARQNWRRALEWNPTYEAAARALEATPAHAP